MANIIRKVMVAGTGEQFDLGFWNAEMLVEHDGREVYASIQYLFETAGCFVTTVSVLEYHMKGKEIPEDLMEEFHQTGIADQYRNEEKMTESEYYSAWLYLNSLRELGKDLEDQEVLEYMEDLGKDTDAMDLTPFAENPRKILYPDAEALYSGFTVLYGHTDTAETDGVLRVSAEAVLIEKMKTVYLEASWTSDKPEEILFEANRTSVHALLQEISEEAEEKIAEVRKDGEIMDMEHALKSTYRKVCLKQILAITVLIRKTDFFKDSDQVPEWYRKNSLLV